VSENPKLCIGHPVWRFDMNHREYRRDANGGYSSAPDWRSHWVRFVITGETSRSWIAGERWIAFKIPKCDPHQRGLAYSEEELDRLAWVNDNRYPIGREVERLSDFKTLSAVAEVIGYKAKGAKA
jgi:hypothetical protein